MSFEEWVLRACKGTIIVLGKVEFDERLCFQFLVLELKKNIIINNQI